MSRHTTTTHSVWIPDWLRGLGMAAWLVDPDAVLSYMNVHAERALDLSAEECLGAPCWQAIQGMRDSGGRHCSATCPLRARAVRGDVLKPFMILRGARGTAPDCFLIQPLRLEAPDGSSPHLVHLATDMKRARRLQAYLEGALTCAGPPAPSVRPRDVLSRREAEVLEHLARNEDQKQIAARLCVSYVTIRHHVQSILRKLNAHSIQEAVALELFSE